MQHTLKASLDRVLGLFAALFEVRGGGQGARSWEALAVLAWIVIGAILRFWGLGSWGLEGDEKTMALPTMHLVRYGSPLMPSGMFYGRAIAQLYMMAASVRAFGESEWAFRIPSVICGIALIGIAYFVGRRFLAPVWNMAFVGATALLPVLIADSQEARMYIFLVTCLAAFTALVFKWERSDRPVWLVAAVVVLLIGIQFHLLAVFGSLLLLFPGLLTANVRKVVQGGVGVVVAVVGFVGLSRWMESFYIPGIKADPRHIAAAETHIASLRQLHAVPLLIAGLIAAALLAIYVARSVKARAPAIGAGALLFAGMICELAVFYHLGLILILAGALLAERNGGKSLRRIGVLVAVSLVLAASQFFLLHQATGAPLHKTLGTMMGLPSPWSFLRALDYSPLAWLTVVVAAVFALWRIAQRRRVSDYWLFFMLAVWLPLFGLGLFAWDVEIRYTQFALLPLLLCAFAACQELSARLARRAGTGGARPALQAAVAGLALVLFVNPVKLAHAVNAGYSIHPDHKGAAEYIRSIGTRPNDVIVAEDSLQQAYYLGHIDFWLRGMNDAAQFSYPKGGTLHDIYTDAPLIGSGAALLALVARRDRGAIYVIGTGEFKGEELRVFRSDGIYQALQRPDFTPVFRGRDGLTMIWKVPAPSDVAAGAERSP